MQAPWNRRSSFVPRRHLCVLLLLAGAWSCSRAQQSQTFVPGTLLCPGGFPTDLTVTNCSYTEQQRFQQWVNSSLTDQAMLGAVVYGAGAQIIKSPGEWGRTWGGYGDRIGVRYTQGAARGTAEFIVGNIMRDDPRHISYKDDPLINRAGQCPTGIVWKRIGHAFEDSVTVRQSEWDGKGKRRPALDRLVGVAAGAYGGYAWYPRAENTLPNAAERAASSYGSTLLGSFYTEFSPELFKGLTWIVSPKKKLTHIPKQPCKEVSTKP